MILKKLDPLPSRDTGHTELFQATDLIQKIWEGKSHEVASYSASGKVMGMMCLTIGVINNLLIKVREFLKTTALLCEMENQGVAKTLLQIQQ